MFVVTTDEFRGFKPTTAVLTYLTNGRWLFTFGTCYYTG